MIACATCSLGVASIRSPKILLKGILNALHSSRSSRFLRGCAVSDSCDSHPSSGDVCPCVSEDVEEIEEVESLDDGAGEVGDFDDDPIFCSRSEVSSN